MSPAWRAAATARWVAANELIIAQDRVATMAYARRVSTTDMHSLTTAQVRYDGATRETVAAWRAR